MIAGIASLVFIPLLALCFAHLMWAFGSTWPVRDEALLAKTVIGTTNVTNMPRRLRSFGMAMAMLAAGLVALSMTDPAPSWRLTLAGFAIAAIFLIRGGAGFTPRWRQHAPEEPFATFNRRLYSPLSLFLGAGFVFLAVWRLFS